MKTHLIVCLSFMSLPLNAALDSLAKSGASAAGGSDIAYGTAGFGALNPTGSSMLETGLLGSGAAAGKNKAMFSDIGGPLNLHLQKGSFVSGLGGLPTGARVATLTHPILNRNTPVGIYQVTVTGSGINTSSNRLLVKDDGSPVSSIIRTGVPIPDLGGATMSGFREVLQLDGTNDMIILGYSLKVGVAGVNKTSSTGILLINHAGAVLAANAREGNTTGFGLGDPLTLTLGKFGRASTSSTNSVYFLARKLDPPALPVETVFQHAGGVGMTAVSQGSLAGGTTAGEKYGILKGLTRVGPFGLVRATLKPSPTATNEGVWNSGGSLMLRKGQEISPDVKITKIIRVWGIDNGQVVAHVTLTGNKTALILVQTTNGILELMSTGQIAPGAGGLATVGSLQAIDVDPVKGHYTILGSLRGVSSRANQALWSGTTTQGDDTTAQSQRLPVLRLQKGTPYSTSRTFSDTIKGLSIKPAVDSSGVGGRGLAQIINSSGQILLTITGDRAAKETVRLTP
jgi:hypothetical protein